MSLLAWIEVTRRNAVFEGVELPVGKFVQLPSAWAKGFVDRGIARYADEPTEVVEVVDQVELAADAEPAGQPPETPRALGTDEPVTVRRKRRSKR